MVTAKQIGAAARRVMKDGGVIISGIDLTDGAIRRIQVYFWD